jgi:hypothetical protein
MPKSPTAIADEIAETMRKEGMDFATLKWPDFYSFTERERIKGGFMDDLRAALQRESIIMIEGVAIVAFVKDFDAAPLLKKRG